MTSSADQMPPALSSMWRLCKLGFRYEPRLMSIAFGLSVLAALPDALKHYERLGADDLTRRMVFSRAAATSPAAALVCSSCRAMRAS